MPALYTSTTEFQQSPVGVALTAFWQNLQPGVLDRLCMAASDEVDSFTKRKIGAPQYSYNLTAVANSGAQTIQVDWGTGIYPNDVIYFATSGEVVEVDSVQITSFAQPPYSGTIYLNTPLANSYSLPTTIQVYRQDRITIRGRATNALDDQVAMSQMGQIARMHAPKGSGLVSARKLFVKQYPLLSLFKGYQALPWTNAETVADFSGAYLSKNTGILTLPVGYFNPIGSIWRLQYFGGYHAPPQDVRDAANLYVAAKLSRAMNPIGANEIRNQGQLARMTRASVLPGSTHPPRSFHVEEAERLLLKYRRKGH